MDEPDITAKPYAEYLEEALRFLAENEPRSFAFAVMLPDGAVAVSYYEATPFDKALFAHTMQSDAMMDEIEANASWLRDVVDNAEDDEDAED